MKRRPAPKDIKKKTQKYYNYKIKGHLVRDYRKPKTKTELPQK